MGRGEEKIRAEMKLKISPFAEQDLKDSLAFYNERLENLGAAFFQEINLALERIKQTPNRFPRAHNSLRKYSVVRFPFLIFYIEKDDVCYVLAIFHTSRNPKIIRERYKSIR
jgi:toxin ParE1/3/4